MAAGCAQGNHAARLALYDILQKSHELHPSTTTAQWVDDLAQRMQAPPREVVNKAVEAAVQLVQDLQGGKLVVASKSVVFATTPQIAKQVVSSLARHEIHIQEASQTRDWDRMCRVQESLHVVPWPRDGSKLEDEREDVRGSAGGPRSKLPRGSGRRGLGRRKLMVLRRWVRRRQGSSKRGQERLKLHNAEVEAGV